METNNFHLLVDSAEFMDDLEKRIIGAKDRVLIQAMTFEADKAGMRLYDALKKSSANEKILCVDAYSLANINDGWAYDRRYLTNKDHKKEVDDTRRILKSSNEFGIRVVITNPLGLFGIRYPFRNHKKLMVVDDVVFLGGINFSEHNFEWHDFMIRISVPEVVDKIVEDFQFTCQKINQSSIYETDSGRLYFLSGINSKREYEVLFNEILSAKKNITILSPYVSDPLLSKIKSLGDQVDVNIITPKENNKSLMKNGLYDSIKNTDYNLYEYGGGMSHLKAILVDDTKLIFGSSNFDVVSYYLEEEIVMISEDAGLISQFKERILAPDIEQSELIDLRKMDGSISSRLVMIILKKIVAILAFLFTRRNDHKV